MEIHCDYKFTCDGRLGVHLNGGGNLEECDFFSFQEGKTYACLWAPGRAEVEEKCETPEQRGWLTAPESLRMERTGEDRGEKVVLSRK